MESIRTCIGQFTAPLSAIYGSLYLTTKRFIFGNRRVRICEVYGSAIGNIGASVVENASRSHAIYFLKIESLSARNPIPMQ